MKQTKAAQEFSELYGALYHLLHTRWAKDEARPSPEALAVLMHLKSVGPLTVSEAARHFKRAQSAMSEMLDRLQSAGWLERMPDARDRRRTLVWLTERGEQMLARSQQVLDLAALAACLTQLSEGDREQLLGLLRRLVNTAQRLREERTKPA